MGFIEQLKRGKWGSVRQIGPAAGATAFCLVMALAAGCGGGDEPADPTRANPEADEAGAETLAEGDARSERPVDLPLDDVRPCDLFTGEVRHEFQLRARSTPAVDAFRQPKCHVAPRDRGGDLRGGYIVKAAIKEGMERFEGIPEQLAKVRSLSVAGFPAAELRDVHQPFACTVGVDVADGQYLDIYVSDVPYGGSEDEICKTAERFASAMVASLRAHHGR